MVGCVPVRAPTIALLAVALLSPLRARAQCPAPPRVPERCVMACTPGASAAGDQLVNLDDELAVRSDCTFSVAGHEGAALASGPATQIRLTYAELWARVAASAAFQAGRVNLISGVRPGVRNATADRVGLEPCTFDLATLALRPEATRVTRTGATDCHADRLQLVLVRNTSTDPWLSAVPADAVTIAPGAGPVPIPDASTVARWTLYARAANRDVPLLRLAELATRQSATPLQQYVAAARAGTPPFVLARATWIGAGGGAGGFALARGDQGAYGVWDELLAALDSGLAHVSVATDHVAMGVDSDGGALRFPDAFVDREMRGKLGEAGARLVPTAGEWSAMLARASLCVSATYRAPAQGAAPAPLCAALSAIVAAVAPPELTATVANRMQDLRANTAPGSAPLSPDRLPVTSTDAVGAVGTTLVVGDALEIVATGSVCASIDDHTLAQGADAGPGTPMRFSLDRPGVLELRAATTADCNTRSGLTLLRVPVIDPGNDWSLPDVPAGGCGRAECTPWSTLVHDDDGIFRLNAARTTVASTLRTTESVRALAHFSRQVPVAVRERRDVDHAAGPALYVVLSRDGTCPAASATFDRDRPAVTPADVAAAATDTTFHAFLVGDAGGTRRCLATYAFYTGHPRTLAVTNGAAFPLEVGLLGDPRLAISFDGVVLALADLAWVRWSLTRWLGVQIGVPLDVGLNLSDATDRARAGIMVDGLIEVGIPDLLPRLLSVGTFVTYLPSIAQTWAAGFVSLNLTTIAEGVVRLLRELDR